MGKVNNIIALGLKNHLRQNKFNIDGFKILKEVLNDDKGITLNKVLEDESLKEKYKNWASNQDK